jgi:SAM-dependent methyltransferase
MPATPSSNPTTPAAFGAVAPYYDHLMSGVPYRFWIAYVERLWKKHNLAPKSVLDLACGTGTATRMLAQRGYVTAGVDLSSPMVAIARERAQEENLVIPFYEQDAADMDLGESRFDAIISLFDSLNNILEDDRLQSAFRRMHDHLNPGGSFIFDVNTEFALEQGMFNQSCSRKDEPLHYRWRSRYNPETRICTVSMTFSYDSGTGERETFKETHIQKGYAKDEITRWLKEAGFATVTVYDGYSTDPPRKRSDRLFYVAVK